MPWDRVYPWEFDQSIRRYHWMIIWPPKHMMFYQITENVLLIVAPFPPQIFLFHNVTIIHPEDFTQCTTRGSFITHWHETAYNMFTFSCLFLLPLIIMITCYTRIFCEISKRLNKDNCEFKSSVKFSVYISDLCNVITAPQFEPFISRQTSIKACV